MGKRLGFIKGFYRLRSIHLKPPVGAMRMGESENLFVITGPFFLPLVRGMKMPQMMQGVTLKTAASEKYSKSWSQSLSIYLLCMLSWRREKLMLSKGWYLHFRKVAAVLPNLIGQDVSASLCSQQGTSAALAHAHSIPVPMGYDV